MKRFYKINQFITSPKVRLVDEKGNQLGVVNTQEALFKARQKGLDLVEVAEKADPPVCKVIDFKKFKYQEDKKQRSGKKGRRQDLKQIRFTPFIASKDFEVRLTRATQFLKEGHKVKLIVKFVGRQITRKQFGYELLSKATDQLKEISKIESQPKFQGRFLNTVLAPRKVVEQNEQKKGKKVQTKNQKVSPKKV